MRRCLAVIDHALGEGFVLNFMRTNRGLALTVADDRLTDPGEGIPVASATTNREPIETLLPGRR